MATRTTTRVFILITTALFIASAFGLTIFGVWTQLHENSSSSSTSSQTSCPQDVATEPTFTVPGAYIAPGSVKKLQVTDLEAGSGAAAKVGDCLVVKYDGMLASSGKVFQEDFDQPSGLAFPLGRGQVIPGWDQGLVGMKVGGTRRLVIPTALAYGAAGSCNTPDPTNPQKCVDYAIPPNADLVFVVKLLRIQ